MPFASGLRESLRVRKNQVSFELTRGDSLGRVLDRHLLTVEDMADGDLLTSILLLSPDGKRLYHGAAPNLPESYCREIDGLEIGPRAGSCGTAAFFGRPVYVTDIAADPLWADFRHLALPQGLRSCWSTPIREPAGTIIGTFAIYHRTARGPSRDELDAIAMIAEHVADAIIWARQTEQIEKTPPGRTAPRLRLASDNDCVPHAIVTRHDRLLRDVARLEAIALDLDRCAASADSEECSAALKAVAEDSRKLASVIRRQLAPQPGLDS
jgi:GAF domain-containing protein